MKEFRAFSYRQKEIVTNGIYHITQRAPGGELLFLEEKDYITFLSFLKSHTKKFSLETFNFCLMTNHLHILLRIKQPNLTEAMHSLFTNYAIVFNKKYQRKGHVFAGVFRAAMCLDDAHLLAASLYIHLNPQKAGLVNDNTKYKWSSVKLYTTEKITSSFIKRDFILNLLSKDTQKAISLYRQKFSVTSATKEFKNIIEDPKAVYEFAKANFKKILNSTDNRGLDISFLSKEIELDKMIEDFRMEKQLNTPTKRKSVAYLIKQLQSRGYKIQEIANMLGKNRITLSRLLKTVTFYVEHKM